MEKWARPVKHDRFPAILYGTGMRVYARPFFCRILEAHELIIFVSLLGLKGAMPMCPPCPTLIFCGTNQGLGSHPQLCPPRAISLLLCEGHKRGVYVHFPP